MVEVGKGDKREEEHFVEVTDMVEIGKGDQRVEDHFVEVTDMIEIGRGGQRVELFGLQVPGGRRSTAPNHKRAAPREVRRNPLLCRRPGTFQRHCFVGARPGRGWRRGRRSEWTRRSSGQRRAGSGRIDGC
jgi:hypothetical protein